MLAMASVVPRRGQFTTFVSCVYFAAGLVEAIADKTCDGGECEGDAVVALQSKMKNAMEVEKKATYGVWEITRKHSTFKKADPRHTRVCGKSTDTFTISCDYGSKCAKRHNTTGQWIKDQDGNLKGSAFYCCNQGTTEIASQQFTESADCDPDAGNYGIWTVKRQVFHLTQVDTFCGMKTDTFSMAKGDTDFCSVVKEGVHGDQGWAVVNQNGDEVASAWFCENQHKPDIVFSEFEANRDCHPSEAFAKVGEDCRDETYEQQSGSEPGDQFTCGDGLVCVGFRYHQAFGKCEAASTPSTYHRTQGNCRGGTAWSTGKLYDCSPDQPTDGECAAACDANSECGGYDLRVTDENPNECCLFKDGQHGDGNPNRVCMVKQAPYTLGSNIAGSCLAGNQHIEDADTCEAAAAKLGFAFRDAKRNFGNQPKGCFRNHARTLFINSHPTGCTTGTCLGSGAPVCKEA